MNGAPWGGSEELWSQAAAWLARRGVRAGCLVFRWRAKEDRLEALRAAGVAVHQLPNLGRLRRGGAERLLHEGVSRPAAWVRARLVPWGAYDHVLVSQGAHEADHGPVYGLLGRVRSYSLLFHSYREDERFPAHRARRLRGLVAGAAHNLFAAERIRAALERQLDFAIPRAAVVHNPLGFAEPAEAAPLPGGDPARLVTLGALQLATRAHDLILAALSGARWRDRAWRLEVFGSGPDAGAVQALVARHGLADRVALHGHTRDARAALEGAHLLVQVTRQDALPLALTEAMALGRPALVTDVGDMAAWVEEGRSGFVAGAVSLESVEAALERAWAARARWPDMGSNARARYLALRPRDPCAALADLIGAGAA
jgi:glycosyltransferase involved in cell wall biosynthesis